MTSAPNSRRACLCCRSHRGRVNDTLFLCHPQFVTASPSPRFEALHDALPRAFVGTRQQLQQLVEWVSREMEQSFRQQGQALPPWREQRAILTKWQPRKEAPQTCVEGVWPGSPRAAAPCSSCACGAGSGAPEGSAWCCGQQEACLPSSLLVQQVADMATSSAPTTPTHHDHAAGDASAQRRTSLLSRSLEAAGLRRASNPHPAYKHFTLAASAQPGGSSASAGGVLNPSWFEPRIRVVRRGAHQPAVAAQPTCAAA